MAGNICFYALIYGKFTSGHKSLILKLYVKRKYMENYLYTKDTAMGGMVMDYGRKRLRLGDVLINSGVITPELSGAYSYAVSNRQRKETRRDAG